MGKILKVLSLSVLFSFLLNNSAAVLARTSSIDSGNLSNGVVKVSYSSDAKTKVVIKKGSTSYTYDLNDEGTFPLQLGNGEYNITVYENVAGKKYKPVESKDVKLDIKNNDVVFLQSIELINWNSGMDAIKKANELTRGLRSDEEKVAVIYNYILNHLSYDYKKADKLSSDYIPSVEQVFDSSEGICYDYSVLLAAMLRGAGVAAKLEMGYKNDIKAYHAWNQVYLKESGKWVLVDTTYDSILKDSGKSTEMFKNSSLYKVEKQY